MNLLDDAYGSLSTLVYPSGVDLFLPVLINDLTVVNRHHVTDLRKSVCAIENSIVGVTPFTYAGTNLIQDGYNLKTSLEVLDQNLFAVQQTIGFVTTGIDGYAGRIDAIEFGLNAHRIEDFETDADGYSVHGVDGYVAGTNNIQILTNKIVDSGTAHVGPKFIARGSLADVGNDMIQVKGFDGITNVARINWRGDAYFAGNIEVEGDRVIKGMDVIESSLTVDGDTILGNNASIDTVTINGNTSIDGTLSVTGNFTQTGSNSSLGDDTGTLDLDFNLVDISQDGYIRGSLTVDGSSTLGDASGDNHTIRGSILHSLGVLHSTGEFRALGTKFRVEGDTTTIETDNFVVNADSQLGSTLLEQSGNITSDGYLYQFGEPSTTSLNAFVINASTIVDDLIVTNDVQISSGSLTAPDAYLQQLCVTGPVKIADGSEGIQGYVWTSTDTLGNGEWSPAVRTPWESVIVDGYTAADAYGSTPLVPLGFYNAVEGQEVFVRTDSYGSFTINLPSNPDIGDRVRFVDFNGSWSSTNRAIVFPENAGVVKSFTSPAAVDPTTDRITIPLHGLITGQRGTLTTTGTLPGGLEVPPFVFVIALNISEIQFAATLEDALAIVPVPINITSFGIGTHTFTSGTIQGSGFLELDVPGDWAEITFNGTSWRVLTS